MRKYKVLLMFFCFLTMPLFGLVKIIDCNEIEKNRKDFITLHEPTECGDEKPRIDFKTFSKYKLVAKVNTFFGGVRFFSFESDKDVSLLKCLIAEGGSISWYYVNKKE